MHVIIIIISMYTIGILTMDLIINDPQCETQG